MEAKIDCAASANCWYTEEMISSYLSLYLKKNGFKIVADEAEHASSGHKKIIAQSWTGHKEIIEVRGYASEVDKKEEPLEKEGNKQQEKSWFLEALFSSFVNFGKYFLSDKVEVAIGLPDVDRYHQILEKVQDYFTANNIDLKIYLVSEGGEVKSYYLNRHRKIRSGIFFK